MTMTSLEIKETIKDPECDFSVKRFRIGNLDIEGPLKTIDAKNVTRWMFEKEKQAFDVAIFETAKTIGPASVASLLHERDPLKISNRFGFKQWISTHPNLLTFTFDFNPFEEFGELNKISGFFDYYHQFSETAVFVPSVKVQKRVYDEVDGRRKLIATLDRMKSEDYRRYVDDAHKILSFKNKKPIFVPIPLEFGMEGIKEFAEYCLKSDFCNAWVDFQSSPTTNKTKLALLRHFKRIFEENERLDDLTTHSTNIRREIILHSKEDLSPSSDILASVIGSDLVGVNRNPPVPMDNEGKPPLTSDQKLELWRHKARVFEPSSYYYLKVHQSKLDQERINELMDKKSNILHNSSLLSRELTAQRDQFLDELSIKPYISSKPMIEKFRDGELKGILFGEPKKFADIF
jgi:hypothetical protein